MAKQKKNGTTRVLSVLTRGPKKGLSRAQIAERAGLSINSTGPILTELGRDGKVEVVGTLPSTGGRPTNLWAAV